MKKLVLALVLVSTPAFAQQQQPSAEEIQAQCLIETGLLRQALGQAQAKNIQLEKQLEALAKKVEPAPVVKKDPNRPGEGVAPLGTKK